MDTQPNNALDTWAPRRQASLSDVRARATLVRRMRLGLMVLATITVGVFVGYVFSGLFDSNDAGTLQPDSETVTMLNPRIRGFTPEGELRYLIIAESAARRRSDGSLIDLRAPKLTRDDSSEITAVHGTWNRDSEVLELNDEVVITDWAGYVLYSSHAVISMRDGTVVGDRRLQGTGPLGDLRADSYKLFDSGERIRLTGNVKTTIYPKQEEDEDLP